MRGSSVGPVLRLTVPAKMVVQMLKCEKWGRGEGAQSSDNTPVIGFFPSLFHFSTHLRVLPRLLPK